MAYFCELCCVGGNHKRNCPNICESGKVRFRDERSAQMVLTNAKIRAAFHNKPKRREVRTYLCPYCHGWHLTSKPAREEN